jgi:hypothetical protein
MFIGFLFFVSAVQSSDALHCVCLSTAKGFVLQVEAA